MAEPATAGDEQQFKQRAMRRLVWAVALIVAAIVGLGLLDRYSGRQRAVVPELPSSEPPPIATLPEPKPLEPTPPNAQAPAAQPTPALPPPPPPVVGEPATAPSPPGRIPAQASSAAKAPQSTATETPGRSTTPPGVEGRKPHSPGSAPAVGPGAAQALEGRQGFVVQLGVFTTVENAQALQATLKEQGIPAFLETRIVVGPFRDRAEADAAQRKLKGLGVGGVIVQRK